MKLQQAEQIIKQCTFKPNIERSSSNNLTKKLESPKGTANQIDVAKKLYSEACQKQIRMKANEENKKDIEWEKNQDECTFSPKYISKMYIILNKETKMSSKTIQFKMTNQQRKRLKEWRKPE